MILFVTDNAVKSSTLITTLVLILALKKIKINPKTQYVVF